MPVAFCIRVPERQAEAWLVRGGHQGPAARLWAPSKSIRSIRWQSWKYSTCQVGHGDADACVQVRCAVPGDLEVVRRLRRAETRSPLLSWGFVIARPLSGAR
jgi:hypothetical protein